MTALINLSVVKNDGSVEAARRLGARTIRRGLSVVKNDGSVEAVIEHAKRAHADLLVRREERRLR